MFVIPTIFTAVDKISGAMSGMGGAVNKFATRAEAAVARSERGFKKFTPVLGHASKELLSFASTAAVAAGIVETIHFGIESAVKYEQGLASLGAMSGKSGKDLDKFREKANEVANVTEKTGTGVAKAFEIVGSKKRELFENADALGEVTKATIILAEATGYDLESSATSVTTTMNAFNLATSQSERVVNLLAASAQNGSLKVEPLAQALAAVGNTAQAANMSLEETASAIQVVDKFTNLGAESGGKLQKVILKLQNAHIGYKSGLFNLGDAIEQINGKLGKMHSAKQKDAAINKLFGGKNAEVGRVLINNGALYDEYTKKVTNNAAAEEMAQKRTHTFEHAVEVLQNAFVRLVEQSGQAGTAMNFVREAVIYLAHHLGTVLKVIGFVIGAMVAWKIINITMKAVLIATRAISTAFYLVDMIKYVASTQGLTFAQAAWAVATQSATTSQLALNAAMLANPIGIVVIALAALVAAVYAVYDAYKQLEAIAKKEEEHKKAIKDESFAVQDLEKKYLALGKSKKEAQQMAITDSKKSIIAGLTEVQKGLASPDQVVKEAAMAKLNVLSGKAEAIQNPNKAFDFSGNRFANSEDFKTKALSIGVAPGPSVAPTDWLNMPSQKEAINSKEANRQASVNDMITQTNNAKVEIEVKAPEGTTDTKSNNDFVKIKTTSTMMTAH